jgi:hypothetical protein
VDVARRAAAVAANEAQARLWEQAAVRGSAVGLERAVITDHPVTSRRLAAAAATAAAQPAPKQPPVVIPPRVETQIRILSEPTIGPGGFSGAATVVGVSGDRLELELGQQGQLVVLARAAKAPIPVKLKQQVRLVYVPRRNLRAPEEVLVIRTPEGKGIGRIVQGGNGPITFTVPLFGVSATQKDLASPGVVLSLGNEPPQAASPGGSVRLGDVFVRVVASYARTGNAATAAEGPPYLINLLVWSP